MCASVSKSAYVEFWGCGRGYITHFITVSSSWLESYWGRVAFVKGGDEEENEEPPQVVVTEVKEEDAFYSKKWVGGRGARAEGVCRTGKESAGWRCPAELTEHPILGSAVPALNCNEEEFLACLLKKNSRQCFTEGLVFDLPAPSHPCPPFFAFLLPLSHLITDFRFGFYSCSESGCVFPETSLAFMGFLTATWLHGHRPFPWRVCKHCLTPGNESSFVFVFKCELLLLEERREILN